MSDLTVLGRDVSALRLWRGSQTTTCMLPGPNRGEVCSLPIEHDGDHAVEILVWATIARFTSDLENPMAQPDDQQRAAEQRAKQTDRNQKPAGARRPSPRDVLPRKKPEQR